MQNRNYHQYLAIILHGHTYVFSNQNEQNKLGGHRINLQTTGILRN